MTLSDLYPCERLAKMYYITPRKLQDWGRERKIIRIELGTKTHLYSRKSLQEYLDILATSQHEEAEEAEEVDESWALEIEERINTLESRLNNLIYALGGIK